MKKYIIEVVFEGFGAIRKLYIHTEERMDSEAIMQLVWDKITDIVPTAHLLKVNVHEVSNVYVLIHE